MCLLSIFYLIFYVSSIHQLVIFYLIFYASSIHVLSRFNLYICWPQFCLYA